MNKNNILLGVSLTLISALTYAILTALIKVTGTDIKTPVMIFIQVLICWILFLPVAFLNKQQSFQKIIKSEYKGLHFFRTIFSLGISYFLFSAIQYIPLVDGVLLANTAPLIVPFIALIFMGQRLNHKLWIPLIIGFVGIILILKPTSGVFHLASLLALGAGACMASSMLLVRKTASKDSSLTSIFYYFSFGVILSGLASIPFWSAMSSHTLLLLIGLGVLFFIVQIALTYALEYAEAQIVSSLYYSNIIFAAIIAIVFLGFKLDWLTIAGVVLALLGGILTIQVQARAKEKQNCCPVK
tara:strand:- start:296 stop:1192 length:897 start_codon:yes stop_codon:yes gene_type:complete